MAMICNEGSPRDLYFFFIGATITGKFKLATIYNIDYFIHQIYEFFFSKYVEI